MKNYGSLSTAVPTPIAETASDFAQVLERVASLRMRVDSQCDRLAGIVCRVYGPWPKPAEDSAGVTALPPAGRLAEVHGELNAIDQITAAVDDLLDRLSKLA